jgi:hypothetical protein
MNRAAEAAGVWSTETGKALKGRGFFRPCLSQRMGVKAGKRRLGNCSPCYVDAFGERVLSYLATMVLKRSTRFIHPFIYFANRSGFFTARCA